MTLEPCPWCDRRKTKLERSCHGYWLECTVCMWEGPLKKRVDEAKLAWNEKSRIRRKQLEARIDTRAAGEIAPGQLSCLTKD